MAGNMRKLGGTFARLGARGGKKAKLPSAQSQHMSMVNMMPLRQNNPRRVMSTSTMATPVRGLLGEGDERDANAMFSREELKAWLEGKKAPTTKLQGGLLGEGDERDAHAMFSREELKAWMEGKLPVTPTTTTRTPADGVAQETKTIIGAPVAGMGEGDERDAAAMFSREELKAWLEGKKSSASSAPASRDSHFRWSPLVQEM